jgi:hypothetical protein
MYLGLYSDKQSFRIGKQRLQQILLVKEAKPDAAIGASLKIVFILR